MTDRPRIYLDNAATSWPKPAAVIEAVVDYMERIGAAAGRGAYREATQAERIVQQARHGVASLINGHTAGNVVFGLNGTDVLNLAIHGTLGEHDHVVTTVCEHNSVLRPLAAARESRGVSVDYVACDRNGFVSPHDVLTRLRDSTRLVIMTHASNVTGAIQPVAAVARELRKHPAMLLVDAAQTIGHVPIDVQALGVDLLAASGHKGLLGPLGSGILFVRDGIADAIRSTRQGGTGSLSEQETQPLELPDKYESGNPNLVSLAGLAASTRWLNDYGVGTIASHERGLRERLQAGLRMSGVEVWGPDSDQPAVGVVSISIDGYDPQDVAALLDVAHRVQVRGGLHCAPRMHEALGTRSSGGTIRFSVSHATRTQEVDAAVQAVAEIVATAPL